MHRTFTAASTRAKSYAAVAVLTLALCGCGERAQDSPATSPSQPSVVAPAPDVVGAAPVPEATAEASAAAPATPAELPVLFEQLEKPDYKAAYLPLFAGTPSIPAWMKEGGTASPGRVVTIPDSGGGAEYELYSHCKPHDCGDNMMYVLFSRDRKQAWALLMESGKPRTFGNPDAAMTAFLKAQACKDEVVAC